MIERPVIILSLPRTGSTMLFDALAQSPTLYTIGGESHVVIEGMEQLRAERRGYESSRLTATDATPEVAATLTARFHAILRDRNNVRAAGTVRMLEKTPRNALRVPFLDAVFPDALFLYLHRDPRSTISSMLDAWRSPWLATYPTLPGWRGHPWSMLLVPGWRELNGRPLAEIVAAQWATTTRILLDDLASIRSDRICATTYDALVAAPQRELERLCAFAGAAWDRVIPGRLPVSRTALTLPDQSKVARNEADLSIAMPLVEEVAAREQEWLERVQA
ncbi:MAG TPA: sulfotransferase [Thermoanaerobaculia bacterium]|nr:sulfotransferase [Thermoanaerobaculia bacterium]